MNPKEKNVYFTRHGERMDWIDENWAKTAERRTDSPLSPYGFQQAHELSRYISNIQPRITHIYASPFLRTIQTALTVACQLNQTLSSNNERVKVRIEPGYAEYFFEREWTQNNIYRSIDQIPELCSNIENIDREYDSIMKSDDFLTIKVENRQALRKRLSQVIESTLHAHDDDCNILIVTHAAPLVEGVRALISDDTKYPIRTGVCSLTHLKFVNNNKWTLETNGLASYLSKGEQNCWFFLDEI